MVNGFSKVLLFLPNDFLGFDNARYSIAFGLSCLLLIVVGLKYEKMQNEIYKWKNKDVLINDFNKHIFQNDDKQ